MSMPITFTVHGAPKPQGSKRYVGNGRMIEASKALPAWRKAITDTATAHYDGKPLEGPLEVSLTFMMPRPKAWGRLRQDPMIQRPDADKLARAVLDGITGPIIRDDSQVTTLHVTKRRARHGETPGVLITIQEDA